MAYDLIVRRGTIVDGSGLPRYEADLGIVGDRIATIGKISDTAKEVIDADGVSLPPVLSTAIRIWMPRCSGILLAPAPAGMALRPW